MTAKKTAAKKSASSSEKPATSNRPTSGDLVTWQVPADAEEGQPVQTFVGLVVHDVELGPNEAGKDQGKGARVAVLGDLQVIDPKQLQKL